MCIVVAIGRGVKVGGLSIRSYLAPKSVDEYAITKLQVYEFFEFFKDVDMMHNIGQPWHGSGQSPLGEVNLSPSFRVGGSPEIIRGG